ncbi:unnamed protein product [Cunninghamella blakesleeana]
MFKTKYVIIYFASIVLLFFWFLQHITFSTITTGDGDDSTIDNSTYGYFLHITDVHLDMNYKPGTTLKSVCHNQSVSDSSDDQISKTFGLSGCDSPVILAQKTMDWIKNEWKDKLDFVVWTGDNARHDWDKTIIRDRSSVFESNNVMATLMRDALGSIPVIPSLGNNDVVPHNQMMNGDSDKNTHQLLTYYLNLWKQWIPEDQHDQFQLQGGFIHTVSPHIKVISLNSMFFIKKNARSDGCKRYGPAKQHMDWFEHQLSIAKTNGDKVLVIGHVPPNEEYKNSCLNNYIHISSLYSDIIIGHLYGHLNKDHFLLYDATKENVLMNEYKINQDMNNDDHHHHQLELQQQYTFNYMKVKIPKFARQLQKMYENLDPQLDSKRNHHLISDTSSPVVAIQVNPSVLPKFYPTLRVYRYKKYTNTTTNNDFGKIVEYRQYFANITQWDEEVERNNTNFTYNYQLLYSTLKDYGLKELTCDTFFDFAKRMVEPKVRLDTELWRKYVTNIFVHTRSIF